MKITNKIFPIKNVSILQKTLMIIAGLIVVPIAFLRNTLHNDKPNPINNKNLISGVKKCSVSKDF